jgi:hypothetical protein
MSVNTIRRARDDEPLGNEKAEFMAMLKRWLAENEGRDGSSKARDRLGAKDDDAPQLPGELREYLQNARKELSAEQFSKLIEAMIEDEPDTGEGDEPEPFKGRPRPGGAMDTARLAMDRSRARPSSAEFRSFAKRYPHAATIRLNP